MLGKGIQGSGQVSFELVALVSLIERKIEKSKSLLMKVPTAKMSSGILVYPSEEEGKCDFQIWGGNLNLVWPRADVVDLSDVGFKTTNSFGAMEAKPVSGGNVLVILTRGGITTLHLLPHFGKNFWQVLSGVEKVRRAGLIDEDYTQDMY
jgi:hypothetical protein